MVASLATYLSGSKRARRKGRNVAGFDQIYKLGMQIGHGGYGTVHLATHRRTGIEYACKIIDMKDMDALHLAQLENELRVLVELQHSPLVAKLQDAFQDRQQVHIVMELCRGGDIAHAVQNLPEHKDLAYKEAMVQNLMHDVLHTLAICHSKGILHRDVKPENFLLLDNEEGSPVKAIDFGLSAFFCQGVDDPQCIGLKLQGTPWFIPPEALENVFCSAGDIWAAGVMAYYLLAGKYPFDDRSVHPEPKGVFKSIQGNCLDLDVNEMQGYSEHAKDFIRQMLERDPKARPTAQDALHHPWLSRDIASLNEQLALRSALQTCDIEDGYSPFGYGD